MGPQVQSPKQKQSLWSGKWQPVSGWAGLGEEASDRRGPGEQSGVQGRRPVKAWAHHVPGDAASQGLGALGLPQDRLEEGGVFSLSEPLPLRTHSHGALTATLRAGTALLALFAEQEAEASGAQLVGGQNRAKTVVCGSLHSLLFL